MTAARWPIQPLLDLGHTQYRIGRVLRTYGRDWHRLAARGLTDWQADRAATRLGHHPTQIWGWDWITAGLTIPDHDYLHSGWRPAWLWHHQDTA